MCSLQNSKNQGIWRKLKDNSTEIDLFLDTVLRGHHESLWEAACHYIKAGGKRLRPFIVVSTFMLSRNDPRSVYPIAAAVEVLHNFTLIHDDIMDRDITRHSVPTVHTQWGESTAILAGDLLFAMVFLIVQQASLSDSCKTRIMYELAKASRDLCEGQALDLQFESDKEISLEQYLIMVRLKTGMLFKASALIGGIAAEATSDQLHALEQYGEQFGIAFQIIDDILGIMADEKELGKPIGSDIRAGKKTYILLSALKLLPLADRNILETIILQPQKTEDQVNIAIKLIKSSGAIEKAYDLVRKLTQDAINALRIFLDSPAKRDLIALVEISAIRKF